MKNSENELGIQYSTESRIMPSPFYVGTMGHPDTKIGNFGQGAVELHHTT